MTSCSDDSLGLFGGGEEREYRGTIAFDLSTPDVADRTRTVNMHSGGTVLIGNLWLGVFDVNTGQCFGAVKKENFNASMISGTVAKNLIQVDFVARGATIPLAYVVAVANYDGVTTWDGRSLDDVLPDFDGRSSICWDDIINLGISTSTAYAGNKGENENSNAPFMAGFYQDAVSLTQNPKIDQFANDGQRSTAIYPEAAADGMDIQLGDETSDRLHVAAGAICLRRLVSHNTLRFNMSNGYQLTSVKYKRFNMPRSVYMLPRRTDTQRRSNFAEWQQYSPNFADRLMEEGRYETADPTFPYASDPAWNEVPVSSWENEAEINIEFDHFENKHWGLGNLQTQEDRERRNPDGTFAALCSGQADAYNNYASYFILSLHIINKATGESADVEYTLHEGFCNNEDGRRAETQQERCRDFGSFRNVNYNYNINISGISDITASVTSSDGTHPNGQTGNIWKMEFATGSGAETVPVEGGDFNFGGKYMTFGTNPSLGFRLYGTDDKENLIDVCYNMPQGMYEGFYGLWPDGSPTYVATPDAGIPASLSEGMKIVSRSTGTAYTLPEFVKGVNEKSIIPQGQYFFRFTSYDGKALGMKGNFKRAAFIFDRNDSRNAMDVDGCSRYNVAYGGIQNSYSFEVIQYDINKMVVWDNTYYKDTSNGKATVYATAAPIFYGGEAGAIDMRWKHDERFDGYSITVYNANYTSPTTVVGPGELQKYLRKVKGETVFVYPYSTANLPRSSSTGAINYSFRVVPIVDEDRYKVEGNTDVIHNQNGDDATCMRVCPTIWNLSSSGSNDWKGLFPIANKSIDAHYRGLSAYTSTVIGSQYNDNTYWCYGGAGNPVNRYFSFVAAVPGKFAVTCRNHSSAGDASRMIYIIRVDKNGSQSYTASDTDYTVRYEPVYQSNSMPYQKTTFTTPVLRLNDNNEPTEFRIYAGGSIDYYSIQFIPN